MSVTNPNSKCENCQYISFVYNILDNFEIKKISFISTL